MNALAIELDDRATSLARGGAILTSAPSAVFDGTAGNAAGANAWRHLRSQPRATSTRHLGAVLSQRNLSSRAEDLVEIQLKKQFVDQHADRGEHIWIVTPARVEPAGLTSLLGIARRLQLPIDGFMDSATVTTAALGLGRNAVVLELGLHHAAATAVDCEGTQARRRGTVSTERGGLIELHQAWLDLVSTTMVKRTRFDPLHDAATEQRVFDAIPSLALEAATTGNTTASVTKGAERFEVALTRDQFALAAERIYRSVVALIHQLRPAGAPIAIVAPRTVSQLPGLREQLEQFVDCELVSVPDGFAAAATSLLDLPPPLNDGDSVRLLRRVPLQTQAVLGDSTTREPLGRRRSDGPAPSHVLFDGRAYSLNAELLVVGRAPETSSASSVSAASGIADPGAPAAAVPTVGAPAIGATRSISLPDGLAGVSRRHCTFLHDGDQLVLLDHSTFGTFVNGERVQERVRVHAGDRVRIGDPGVELALIAVAEVSHGSAPTDS